MARKNRLADRFRLVYRHSPILLKISVLAAIVLSTAALVAMRAEIGKQQDATRILRAEAAQLERDNQALSKKLQIKGTEQDVRTLAQEELGYVDPDTVFFCITENQN